MQVPQSKQRVFEVFFCDLLEDASFVVYLVLGLVDVIVQPA